jgi:hypothetical protein
VSSHSSTAGSGSRRAPGSDLGQYDYASSIASSRTATPTYPEKGECALSWTDLFKEDPGNLL